MPRTAAGARTVAGARSAAGYRQAVAARNALQLCQTAGLTLRFWLRASDITGVTDATRFGTWTGSDGGLNGIQATGSKQPTYHASGGANNRAYVTFDEPSATFMTTSANYTSTAAWTLFFVWRAPTVGDEAVKYAGTLLGGSTGALVAGGTSFGTKTGFFSNLAGSNTTPLAQQIVAINTWYITVVRHTGGVYRTSLNGASQTCRTDTARSATTFGIGGRGSADQNWDGDFAEVGLIASSLNDVQHDELVRQLLNYYNINGGGTIVRTAA